MFGSTESDPRKSAYCDECYAVIPHGQSTCSRCDTPAQRASDERIISLKQAFNSEELIEKFKSRLPADMHERVKAELDKIVEDARNNR